MDETAKQRDSVAQIKQSRLSSIISLCTPFIGIFVFGLAANLIPDDGEARRQKMLAASAICIAIWLSGLVLGIISFRSVIPVERKGKISRICALVGMLLNFALMLLGIVIFVVGLSELRPFSDHSQQTTSLNQDHSRVAANRLSPEQTAMITKLQKDIKNEIGKIQSKYQVASAAATNPPVLNLQAVRTIDDLRSRNLKVKNFLIAAHELQDYFDHYTDILNEKLQTDVPDQTLREKLRNNILKSLDGFLVKAQEMRKLDVQRAESYIGALNFLENNWGQWEWSPNKPHLHIHDHDLAIKYDSIIEELNSTYREEIQFRAEILQFLTNYPASNEAATGQSKKPRL